MLPSRYFFDNFLNDFENNKMMCDIYEIDGNYIFEIDMPGYNKNDINIDFDNGTLYIKAKRQNINNDEIKYIKKERNFYESLERSFYIGDINEEEIKAELNNSVLKITVPKKEKDNKKSIDID